MAAIPVVFNGVDGNGNPVTLVGSLAYSDRGVGGGPMPGGPDRPVDPGYGYPEKPVDPGYGIPEGGPPRPAHPIVLPPDPPTEPPVDPPTNPPSENWVWGWVPRVQQWAPVYVPGPTDPQPH